MAYSENIGYSGQSSFKSFGGRVRIEENTGRIIITDPSTNTIRQVHDINGSHYNDNLGREMTAVDTRGINTIDPATGMYRGRWGISTTDNRPFGGFSKTGNDIRTLLGE